MSDIDELLVISGKGGTGKTSLTAAFAMLGENQILADCDVDAADLHLLLSPDRERCEPFRSGHEAVIRADDCAGCGVCAETCRFEAVSVVERDGARVAEVDDLACEGCGACVRVCPAEAIDFPVADCGEWYVSSTRVGPMVHARLDPGGENSGKLVSLVREQAKRLAAERDASLILVDGPPGVGCPVIASVTNVSLALVVTEPTPSGEHDLLRVLELAKHFDVPTAVCVNKWDINPDMADSIDTKATQAGATVVGRLPYAPEFTAAQKRARTVVEDGETPLAAAVRGVWERTKGLLS